MSFRDLAKQPMRAQCRCLSMAHTGCQVLRTLDLVAKVPIKVCFDLIEIVSFP